jgi:hypothetical protein
MTEFFFARVEPGIQFSREALMIVAYVSQQCPNSIRFVKIIRRLKLEDVQLYNVDEQPPRHSIHAVPSVVTPGGIKTGTEAFEWLQQYENRLPLEAYATVLGEGGAGELAYTSLDDDETVNPTQFSSFS